MDRVPIALLVDDPCPLVHVYREHWRDVHKKPTTTEYGAELLETIPNSFLDDYCDVMERWGIKGKFSIVPAPAAKGDVVRGIEGFDPALTQEWNETVRRRLGPLCDFCPEGITHNLALNLREGGFFEEGESHWSQHQDRETLTPYLTRSLALLKEAGFDCTGFTSPWVFGIEVEPEYVAAMVAAMRAVYGRQFAWYFLHMLWSKPATRPWIAHRDEEFTLVAIAATVKDWWWDTIDSPRSDRAWIESVTDSMLTADGQRGQIIDVLEAGGWPVVLTHWQSLYSNGLLADPQSPSPTAKRLTVGLAVLEELGRRVNDHLASRVQWMKCSEVAELAVSAG